MNLIVNSFEINGLYGTRDYVVKLDNNQLILVGENGTGKSTIVSIFYYLLTCQFKMLLQYDFKFLTIVVNNHLHKITKDDLSVYEGPDAPLDHHEYISNRLSELDIEPGMALEHLTPDLRRYLVDDIRITMRDLRKILKDLSDGQTNMFSPPPKFKALQDELELHVLFLPTYRRIERDLETLFPTMAEDIHKINRRQYNYSSYRKHIELVEFGMDDVNFMIRRTMKSLESLFRASLDDLTSGYLQVILRKEYEATDVSLLSNIDETYLEEILQKIDESILSESDQKTLRREIKKFSDVAPSSAIDKLSAHIITQLILLHKRQYEAEEKVRSFATVCNTYLKGKRFEFDNKDFTLPIKPINDDTSALDSPEAVIKLNMLSSGEKQIVSLFSHLYLSDINNFFIIIDEPELSLSVTWQKTFLPDMLASKKCGGLVAVTHSPFIYSNDLKEKAHSIQEFLGKGD